MYLGQKNDLFIRSTKHIVGPEGRRSSKLLSGVTDFTGVTCLIRAAGLII